MDPAGCVWIGPEDPVDLGLSVFTAGLDRPLSEEIQRSLELFSKNFEGHPSGHAVRLRTYYSACLPNVPVQSTIDLSADNHILAVVGPICAENIADFVQRMISAQKIAISPVAFRSIPGQIGINLDPDINQLVEQTASWIERLGFTRLIINHDIDDQSTKFSSNLCEFFSEKGSCQEIVAGTTESQPGQFDASVEVFLNESNPPMVEQDPSGPVLPKIVISFSRPMVSGEQSLSFFWVGPQNWNENRDFSTAYFAKYGSYPTSFASWILYDRLPRIYNAVRETALTVWDGSWIIPMTKFKQRLVSEFATDEVFCPISSSDCAKFAFVLYQVSGNEYKLFNP